MVSFYSNQLPKFIEIPGEQSKTEVYPYIPNPTICKKCQEYMHTIKYCNNQPRCRNCSANHDTNLCKSLKLQCYHCTGEHRVGDRRCPKHIKEKEITTLQTREKISRKEALQQLVDINPNNMNYSKALQTPAPNNNETIRATTSKIYQSSNNENQMEIETPNTKRIHRDSETEEQDNVRSKKKKAEDRNVVARSYHENNTEIQPSRNTDATRF